MRKGKQRKIHAVARRQVLGKQGGTIWGPGELVRAR